MCRVSLRVKHPLVLTSPAGTWPPDLSVILTHLAAMELRLMDTLADVVARETAHSKDLRDEVDALIAVLKSAPADHSAALQAALDAANVDAAAQAAILSASDAAMQVSIAAAVAALAPVVGDPPAADAPPADAPAA